MTISLATRAERLEQGRALRKQVPRSAHAKLVGLMDRDANAILESQNARRLPALIGLRRQLMATDAFAYLRGAAAVMAHDLQWQPMAGAAVQACGDCHVMNFDINDFDETLPGVDFTVDLKRLVASVALAAGPNASRTQRHTLAAECVRAYRRRMAGLAELTPFEIWHSRIDLEVETSKFKSLPMRKKMKTIMAKARGEGLERDDNFPSLSEGGAPHIRDKAPRIFHFAPGSDAAEGFDANGNFDDYRSRLSPEVRVLAERYKLQDFVFKAVGVGSVGTFCYVGLFMSGDSDPIFLQVKEASHSVLEVLDDKLAFGEHQGQRVVEGQRMMQAASDIFLGWTVHQPSGRHYYLRILKNRRLGAISEIGETEGLTDYVRLCGRTLARAHARSGDAAVMAGYMGDGDTFDLALADFALAYARQTEIDHAAWAAAYPAEGPTGAPDSK